MGPAGGCPAIRPRHDGQRLQGRLPQIAAAELPAKTASSAGENEGTSRKNRRPTRCSDIAGKVALFAGGNEGGLEKIAPKPDAATQPAKVTPFAGGNEGRVSKKSPQAIFSSEQTDTGTSVAGESGAVHLAVQLSLRVPIGSGRLRRSLSGAALAAAGTARPLAGSCVRSAAPPVRRAAKGSVAR